MLNEFNVKVFLTFCCLFWEILLYNPNIWTKTMKFPHFNLINTVRFFFINEITIKKILYYFAIINIWLILQWSIVIICSSTNVFKNADITNHDLSFEWTNFSDLLPTYMHIHGYQSILSLTPPPPLNVILPL